MTTDEKTFALWGIAAIAGASFIAGIYVATHSGQIADATKVTANAAAQAQENAPGRVARNPQSDQSIELSEKDLALVRPEPIGEREFPIEKTAVGNIDFNQDMTVQVFTPYQGRIANLFAKLGDDVTKGQVLFTIDSPDLVQASSTLISASGVLELTTRNLIRLRGLYETRAVSQKELEQAASDQQTAESALRGARDAVRLFGKTDEDIARMVKERRVDPVLIVRSPGSGRISARNAAPGLFVQPGNAPAPYSVADASTMWMVANVPEADAPAYRIGQPVTVKVSAYPDPFEGRIITIGLNVDPTTRRVLVRSEIKDPKRELWAGMFATFVIQTGEPVRSLALPLSGVVREGDGTMVAWVTTDRRRFLKRAVRIGLQYDGYHQILEGLQPGELVATEGALFLNNALAIANK
jgi:cobalt-zinc-cadmium efflux system membrane fusion protein